MENVVEAALAIALIIPALSLCYVNYLLTVDQEVMFYEKEAKEISSYLAAKFVAVKIVEQGVEKLSQKFLTGIKHNIEKTFSLKITYLRVELLKVGDDGVVSVLKAIELRDHLVSGEDATVIAPLGYGLMLKVKCKVLPHE